MIPSRTLLAAAIALAVVVCTDTPTATDAVDGLAFATVGGPSATGSGHIVDDRSSSLPFFSGIFRSRLMEMVACFRS